MQHGRARTGVKPPKPAGVPVRIDRFANVPIPSSPAVVLTDISDGLSVMTELCGAVEVLRQGLPAAEVVGALPR